MARPFSRRSPTIEPFVHPPAPAGEVAIFEAGAKGAAIRRPWLLGLALLLWLPGLAHTQTPSPGTSSDSPAGPDVVEIRVWIEGQDAAELQVGGDLEGPAKGRPDTHLPIAGLPFPILLEVAILDRDQKVIEAHIYPEAPSSSEPQPAALAKVLLEPGLVGVAVLEDGTTLRFELLSLRDTAEPQV